jgi:hypothetical protein
VVTHLLHSAEGLERCTARLSCGKQPEDSPSKAAEYEHRNALKEDFDKDKVQGMTFARWGQMYLERYARGKRQRSQIDDQRYVLLLSEYFGYLLLSQITRGHVEEFKQTRKNRQTWKGTPVSEATCNRELACLRHILRLAAEEDLKRIMAITGHKTFAVFQRDNNPSEEDVKAVVLANPPQKMVG